MAGAPRSHRGGKNGRSDGAGLARRRPPRRFADHCRAQSVGRDRFARGEPRRCAQPPRRGPARRACPRGEAPEPRSGRAADRRARGGTDAPVVDHRGQDHRQSDGAAPSGARCRAGDAQYPGRDRPRGHGGFRQRGRQCGAAALVRAPARRGRRVLLARGRGRDRRRDRDLRLRPGLRVRPHRGARRSGARDWACRRSSRWASRGAPSRARRN